VDKSLTIDINVVDVVSVREQEEFGEIIEHHTNAVIVQA
jgi:hypothetical protein